MDIYYRLIFMAFVGAVIGWSTNVTAIKMIFRPVKPFRIPVLGFTLQGLIPKRRGEIAKNIAETVEKELVSLEEIIEELINDDNKEQIYALIKNKLKNVADERFPIFIPFAFKIMILDHINKIIDEESDDAINELTEVLVHKAIEKVSISGMIEEKINMADYEKIEEIILKIAKKELKHIELLGGVIGLVIGLVQGLILVFA
ncbi:MAG TPA: DUF445 family protein [Clostridia bacterium]|nr:DUF445 family protein [Clostridia bacterium]